MFTLRDSMKSLDQYAETCRRIAEIGYKAVQVSGLQFSAPPEEIARITSEAGLTICATHEGSADILNSPESVVEKLRALGCSLTALPAPIPGTNITDPAQLEEFIAKTKNAVEVFEANGLTLAYHNHHFEFQKVNGKIILERLYEEVPQLKGEPDIYWVQYGGGDPVAWCQRLSGRLPIIHLKDYKIVAGEQGFAPAFAEIGQGNLDIPRIIEVSEAGGCQWFAVEQDRCEGDPFEAIATSFEYLSKLAK